jgi:hypothetical protein
MSMTIRFPFEGLNKGGLPSAQPQNTSPKLLNVRPYHQGRLRGGQRPGKAKWGDGDQIGGAEQPVVAMCSVSAVESPS